MSTTEAGQILSEFSFEIAQLEDYRFEVRFDKPEHPVLHTDEPAPLGEDTGPNPSRLLAAAVGNCLSASLVFCARKSPGSCRANPDAGHHSAGAQQLKPPADSRHPCLD